jgi:putative transferase (TIGR04331 family)
MMNYYLNRDSLHQAYNESSQDIEMIMMVLSSELNNIHDTNHDSRYWNIVLESWVRLLVENYYHYNQINDDITLPNFEKIQFDISVNYQDFMNSISSDTVNFRQCFKSLILYLLEHDIASMPIINKQKYHYVNWSFKRIILMIIFYLSKVVPKNRLFSTTIHTPSIFINSFFKLRLFPIPVIERKSYIAPSVNLVMREKLYKIGQAQIDKCDVDDQLWKIVCATIPLCYLEGFLKLLENSKQYGRPTNIVLSHDFHSCDSYKVWVANSVENGTKLIGAQHGGGYGTVFYEYSEGHEIKVSDLFLSWSNLDRSNSIQVPSQKFIQKKDNSDNFSIVMVNVALPSFYKYHSSPIMEQFLQNIDDQLLFLSLLKDRPISHMRIRQYNASCDFPIQKKYAISGFDILVDNDSSYITLISNANLVVHSYTGTSWLETIMNNIPTVVFVNPSHWDYQSEVLPYLDQLRTVGIMHDSPSSAADHVNNIYSNIDFWWSDEHLQFVRSEFCKRFAYTEKNWEKKWINAIQTVLN